MCTVPRWVLLIYPFCLAALIVIETIRYRRHCRRVDADMKAFQARIKRSGINGTIFYV